MSDDRRSFDQADRFFDQAFEGLTGYQPLGWQRRLFAEHFAVFDPPQTELPAAVDIPTGLGKTSVMVVWLLALAWQAVNGRVKLPRRLVYVVNRRTVVDQASDTAEELRQRLKNSPANSPLAQIKEHLDKLCIDPDDPASPLAISTLRGERADNREWQADPSRPAIIVGTVDMIGSRLLFSGYGVSRRMRPFHAGLLGQDTLLIHDEAHLSEPFGKLIRAVAQFQQAQNAPRPLRVVELSATQRRQGATAAFTLTDKEKAEDLVKARLRAVKRLRFEDSAESEDAVVSKIVDLALQYKDHRKRVLVYVQSPGDAREIADRITKATAHSRVALLTGTVRGYERDKLAETPLFKGFRSDPNRPPPAATEYLVATSAGEVGVDFDADHLVCDLTTLDSMIQRLGRVNRLGGREAEIHVVEWPKGDKETEWEKRCAATKNALASLPERDGVRDASPESLRALADRTDAFAPTPRTVDLTDILIDNWALTRVKDLPGRPLPDRWLHGVEGGEPDLHVAWRDEVGELAVCLQGENRNSARILRQLYDKHPILAQERLRGPLSEVRDQLKRLAKRKPKAGESNAGESEEREPPQPLHAILLPVNGDPIIGALSDLLEREAELPNATIILPPSAGGLDARGMLSGEEPYDPERGTPYDVADDLTVDPKNERLRLRVLLIRNQEEGWSVRVLGQNIGISNELAEELSRAQSDRTAARLVRKRFADTPALAERALLVIEEGDEGPVKALQLLSSSRSAATAQDDPAAAARPQELDEHLKWAEQEAENIVARTWLKTADSVLAEAVVVAARWHDRGKNRPAWQRAIGNPPLGPGSGQSWTPWAKSGQRGFDDTACVAYRHEFGSLREASEDPSVRAHPERDLILHLIAAHHGWARPHFEPEQWDIADGVSDEENAAVAAETMRRFARLQRRFGHWGLAWLESLVRAADYAASRRLDDQAADASAVSAHARSRQDDALRQGDAHKETTG